MHDEEWKLHLEPDEFLSVVLTEMTELKTVIRGYADLIKVLDENPSHPISKDISISSAADIIAETSDKWNLLMVDMRKYIQYRRSLDK
jgi:hypothetical protein